MKRTRTFCLLLAFILMLSLCACGKTEPAPAAVPVETSHAGKPAETAEPTTEIMVETEAPVSDESLVDDPAWDMLEGLGKVQTENGVFFVTITIPANFIGESVTQESIDTNAGPDSYTSGKLNDDGSVTYKLTKKQHKAMMDLYTKSIDEALQELVDSPDYAFTSITHNADFTVFDASLSTSEVGITESYMVLGLYMYGGIYGIFSGREVDNIVVNLYGPDGSLISTANSSEMG